MIEPGTRACSGKETSRGFTLLEILVAVTVLGIALVSLLGLHARNIRLTSHTQDMTTATMLASRLVAVTKAGEIPTEGVTEGTFTSKELGSLRHDEVYGGEDSDRFVWKREVADLVLMPGMPPLRLVTIAVGEADADPVAELRFTMAEKAKIRRALEALGRFRGGGEEEQ